MARPTVLHSGASRAASREPPDGRFGAELNGILACFPDGGNAPNHIPIGLLPPNDQVQPIWRACESNSVWNDWLDMHSGKS